MKTKIIIILLVLLITSVQVEANNIVDLEVIQELISDEQYDLALEKLDQDDLTGYPDHIFYKALLISWQGDYSEAIMILEDLIKKYPERQDFKEHLDRVELWKSASRQNKERFLDFSIGYDNNLSKSILLGVENPIQDGVLMDIAVGPSFDNWEPALNLNTSIYLTDPVTPPDLELSFSSNISGLDSLNNFSINSYLTYDINYNQKAGIRYSFIDPWIENSSFYRDLDIEYIHNFERIILLLRNKSRFYENESFLDFSQQIELYYPLEVLGINFTGSRYHDSTKSFRFGIELGDRDLSDKYRLRSLTGWINDQKNVNIRGRIISTQDNK